MNTRNLNIPHYINIECHLSREKVERVERKKTRFSIETPKLKIIIINLIHARELRALFAALQMNACKHERPN